MTENATEAGLSELDTSLGDVSLHRVFSVMRGLRGD